MLESPQQSVFSQFQPLRSGTRAFFFSEGSGEASRRCGGCERPVECLMGNAAGGRGNRMNLLVTVALVECYQRLFLSFFL